MIPPIEYTKHWFDYEPKKSIQMKKYKLLKDLPGVYRGEIFTQDTDHPNFYTAEGDSYYHTAKKGFVEKNPEWFEEVKPKTYTQDDIDEARRRAFNAARKLVNGGVVTGYFGKSLVYDTIDTYLQTINDNKK